MVKTAKISEILEVISLDKLEASEWNANVLDPVKFAKLKQSIKRKGLKYLPVVRKIGRTKYSIIDGHHRVQACRELKFTEIECMNLGRVNDSDAMAMSLTLNGLRGEQDDVKILDILKMLSPDLNLDDLMDDIPFTQVEIDHIFSLDKELNDDVERVLSEQNNTEDIVEPEPIKLKNLKFKINEDQYKKWQDVMELSTNESDVKIFEELCDLYLNQ